MDSLKDTVDKQRRDLDNTRKEMVDKEMLCAALRVSFLVIETSVLVLEGR